MRARSAGLLVALAVLAGAAPARGAQPPPGSGPVPSTASTAYGSVAPVFGSAQITRLDTGATLVADGFPRSLPPLTAAPGGDLVIELDDPVVVARLRIRGREVAPAWNTRLTYMFYLPADEALPARAWLELDSLSSIERIRASWGLELVPAPGSPAPPPAAPAPEPAATVVTGSLRIAGRRLRVAVACPAAALSGCSGRLTLRTRSMRVARIAFAGVPGGTTRTLTARVRAPVRRHLRRHRFGSLRTVLTAPGHAPVVKRLRLR